MESKPDTVMQIPLRLYSPLMDGLSALIGIEEDIPRQGPGSDAAITAEKDRSSCN